MLKKFLRISFLIYIIWLKPNPSECSFQQRQKILLSLSQDLFIRNFILIKPSSFADETKIIKFTKSLSQSHIYASCLSPQEVQTFINDNMGSKITYLKTVILALEEKFNREIFKLINENEKGCSKFIWLVWQNEDVKILEDGHYYIPYNSQLLIVENENGKNYDCSITEMYYPSLSSNTIFKHHVGIWSDYKGLEIPEKNLYNRRINMNRTDLIMVIERNHFHLDSIEYVNLIGESMNFRHTIIFLPENWTIEEVADKWEINSAPFLFNSYAEIDHPILGPTLKTSVHMYIRYDELLEDYGNSPYLRPFSKQLWIDIVLSITIAGICSFLFLYVQKRTGNPPELQTLSAFYHPLEAFLNQYGSEIQEATWIRIIIITTRLTALFIVPAYSAVLLSFTLCPIVKPPFTDIKGFVQDESYKLSFPRSGGWDEWFMKNEDPWKKIAYEKYSLKTYEMPETKEEITEKICQNEKIMFALPDGLISSIHCKIVKIPSPLTRGWYAYRLRKNFSYEKVFNRIFKMLHSTGIVDKYEKGDYMKQVLNKNFDATNEQNPVKLKTIARMLKLMAILYSVSVLTLLFECFHKRFVRSI